MKSLQYIREKAEWPTKKKEKKFGFLTLCIYFISKKEKYLKKT